MLLGARMECSADAKCIIAWHSRGTSLLFTAVWKGIGRRPLYIGDTTRILSSYSC